LGFVASPSRLFVANGGDGTCDMLDGATFARLRTLRFSEDADNVRFDARAGRMYVGYGSGALAVVDAASGDSLGSISLPAHPEAFELETNGPRAFVNIPDAGEVGGPRPEEGPPAHDLEALGARRQLPDGPR